MKYQEDGIYKYGEDNSRIILAQGAQKIYITYRLNNNS